MIYIKVFLKIYNCYNYKLIYKSYKKIQFKYNKSNIFILIIILIKIN